jgi:hypothetical protein
MGMTIRTNHQPRKLLDSSSVPTKILKSEFDWLKNDDGDDDSDDCDNYSYGFIHYLGIWYHTSEFIRLDKNSNLSLLGFDGYHGDSYFSGVLIKISADGESVTMATYYS